MDRSNRNTALASALVEELARCGVRHAVIAPGSRSTPLALALWRARAMETQVIVDERSAGYYALGAAQATGAPVAVLCTSGTAAANLHPAVCEADESGVPLIVLTADRPPELRGIGAGQTIDQIKLYGGAVRWFCELGVQDADDAGLLHFRAAACRAYAAAAGDARPGPVHLNVPWREPLGDSPAAGELTAVSELALAGRGTRPLTDVVRPEASPSRGLLDELAERISQARRGVVVAGRQLDPALPAAAAALAEAAGYPILAEPTSQLRFGEHDRGLVLDAYEPIARARPAELAPELVIRFGEMPTCKPLRQWLTSLEGARQLVVGPDFVWSEPTRRAETIVRASAAATASGVAELLRGQRRERAWLSAWTGAAEAAATAIEARLAGEDELSEPAAHRALASAYRDGELVYTASSMPIRDQEAYALGTGAAVGFLANRGANGIDGLVSSGVGAAAASGRPSWILSGDLGLFHDLNALALLRDAPTPVRLVVFDNRGGGIFEFLPQAGEIPREEFETLFGTPTGLDCERAAALWGIPHRRLESVDELAGEGEAGTELVEVPVDRRRGVILRQELIEEASMAVRAALAVTD